MEKDNHDVLNEHFSDIMNLEAKRSKSDRAALEYIKGLPGFKEAHPDLAAEHDEAVAELDGVEAEIADVRLEWSLRIGQGVVAGDQLTHEGNLYTVSSLTSSRTTGSLARYLRCTATKALHPAVMSLSTSGLNGSSRPVHTTHTPRGAKVTYKGVHYISLIDANVYSPEAYPAGWKAQP